MLIEDYANRLYKSHKNLPIESVIRDLNEIENSCVDYIDVNNSRIQEKVCYFKNNRAGFYVCLKKEWY